ncbi:MAG: formylglycine-generating enzyme family protein [Cyanobacteria bacterium P01_F01_bin.53]
MTGAVMPVLTRAQREERAQRRVERFVARFEPGYYELVCHAALPLVLTPELVSYLRNEFLPGLPWMAEVDLLLSELCSQVGYELYVMDTDVRAYVLKTRSETFDAVRMGEVANLLISYVRYLANNRSQMSDHELTSQQWAAMVYLGAAERRQVVDEIVEQFQACSVGGEQVGAGLLGAAEMAQLAEITQSFGVQLAEYPELIEYAELVSDVQLRNIALTAERVERVYEVGGQQLQLSDDVKQTLSAKGRLQSSPRRQANSTLTNETETKASPSPIQAEALSDIEFPPLQVLEFAYGELVDSDVEPVVQDTSNTFPPPLEPISFKIATISLPQQPFSLEAFKFETATIEYKRAGLLRRRFQWVVTKRRAQARRFVEPLGKDLSLEMVAISGGHFLMGSPDSEPKRGSNEGPQHEVTVPDFFMGRYPVTQAQWQFVANLPQVNRALSPNPSRFNGSRLPVERVSWDDAIEFCDRLSAHTDRQYRLPSEAEWEYACRAGTRTPFHFGKTITTEVANYDGNYTYADSPNGSYRGETTPVDAFDIANPFGLCDMHGNVFEWCADYYYGSYEQIPTDGSAFVTDKKSANHILRGGSWGYDPRRCRSAYRYYFTPSNAFSFIGFRVSCSAPRT